MSDELQPYYVDFTEAWIRQRLIGTTEPPTTEARYLVEDRRKRLRIWKALADAGYIETVSEHGVVTSKAFDEHPSIKPDLDSKLPTMDRDKRFWEIRPGVRIDKLTTSEQKYVVTHPTEYAFFHFDDAWTHLGTGPITFGENMYITGGRYNRDIWVSDEEFTKTRDAALYDLSFHELRRKNLPWALVKLGIIEAVDKDCFSVGDADRHYFSMEGPSLDFGGNPDAWENDLDTNVEKARKEIAVLTRRATVMLAAKDKILQRGGWATLLAAYETLLHDYLKKKTE